MQILFIISILCFFVLLWAGVAIARHIHAGHECDSAQASPKRFVAGFSAMVLYLAEGAMGLPVFNPQGPGGVAQLLGPTAGYLFAYPLAAAAAGWVVRSMRQVGSAFTRGVVAGIAFSVILFALGAGWLATVLHLSAPAAWHLAVAPFLLGEVIKVTAAAAAFSTIQRWRQS